MIVLFLKLIAAEYIRQLVDTKNGLRDRVRELQTVLGEVPDEDVSIHLLVYYYHL